MQVLAKSENDFEALVEKKTLLISSNTHPKKRKW